MLSTLPFPTQTSYPKFHFSFWVKDLEASVAFYSKLFGAEPQKHYSDYAKFEIANPALALSLLPQPAPQGESFNHAGIRFHNSNSIVAIQRRLEESGYKTVREEGVECCYALQTKFWVSDPDGNAWEIYTLHQDISHHGKATIPEIASITNGIVDLVPPTSTSLNNIPSGDIQILQFTKPSEDSCHLDDSEQGAAVWVHNQPDPIPKHAPFPNQSIDEVQLLASFNAECSDSSFQPLLLEAFRVLKSGGRLFLRGLIGDRPYPGVANFPGLSAKYKHIPMLHEPLEAIESAGFTNVQLDTWKEVSCVQDDTGIQFSIATMIAEKPKQA